VMNVPYDSPHRMLEDEEESTQGQLMHH